MNAIPPVVLDHIRHYICAQDVANALGLPKGKERHKWACPACGSSDALNVYREPGRGSHCFSCGQSHDPIDLVRETLGLDFRPAVEWLAGSLGFAHLLSDEIDEAELRKHQVEIAREQERRRREREEREELARRVGRDVYDRIWPLMMLGPAGTKYLEQRAIPAEVAHHVGIRSVESMAEWRELLEPFTDEELDLAGLTLESGGLFPWEAPFLVIPYWFEKGGIDIIRFRSLNPETRWRYLSPRGHKPTVPYLSHAAFSLSNTHDVLFVCEGELNALSVVVAGAPAIGSCGRAFWNAEWSRDFRWFQRVIVLRDPGVPGQEFAALVRERTEEALGRDWVHQRLRQRFSNEGKDANDLLISGQLGGMIRV